MNQEARVSLQREHLPGKERESRQASVIALSGLSGTGKTTAANFLIDWLAEYTGKKITLLKVGEELVRNPYRDATGKEITGDHNQTDAMDVKIEATQTALIHQNPTDEILVLDGWLSGVVAAEEKQKAEAIGEVGPNAISILLVSSFPVRIERGYQRQYARDKKLTKEKYIKDTLARERSNKKRWRKQHPQLNGINFYGRQNRDNQGKPIYTHVINTTHFKTEQELHNALKQILIDNEHVRPKVETTLAVDSIIPNQNLEIHGFYF